MRSFVLLLASICALAAPAFAQPGAEPAPAPAAAEPEPSTAEKIAGAAYDELKRTETVAHKGVLLSLHAGYHGDVAGMAELRVGYGVGKTKESLIFPTTKLWRFSAALRGSYGRADSGALSLLAGRSHVGALGYSLEAGVDARVLGEGDAAFGPIASLGIRMAGLGLHTNVWSHFLDGEQDWGFSIALGFNKGDHVSAGDIAKKRAKERIKAEIKARL